MKTNRKPFKEPRFFVAYKKIRNQFRRYHPLQLIDACIKYLYSPTKNEIDQLQKNPWLVLLLIKWILIDDQFSTSRKKELTQNKFNKILQMMHDLGAKIRMPSEYSHHTLFFRNIAYQQFLYQHPLNLACLARQKILFDGVAETHFFKQEFTKKTNLSIEHFLELGLILLCRYIIDTKPIVTSHWFDTIKSHYSSEEVNSLLELTSVDLYDMRNRLLQYETNKRTSHEYYEQTPFLNFPLIKLENKYICVYPNILYRTIEHFIYDNLREWNSTKFMAKFGDIFERYVERGLLYSGITYVAEKTLNKELDGNGKVVDFLINDGESNIFVDSKAVEMARQGKVTHLANIVKDRVKTSIIKAIEQAFDVLRRLKDTDSSNPIIKHRKNNYLLVITFKELYLGNGQNLFDAVAKDKLQKLIENYKDSPQIALENMYFITIDEFDYFVQLIKDGKITFASGLSKARESDCEAKTRKFDFTLHLRSWDTEQKPPIYVRKEADLLFSKIETILRNSDELS